MHTSYRSNKADTDKRLVTAFLSLSATANRLTSQQNPGEAPSEPAMFRNFLDWLPESIVKRKLLDKGWPDATPRPENLSAAENMLLLIKPTDKNEILWELVAYLQRPLFFRPDLMKRFTLSADLKGWSQGNARQHMAVTFLREHVEDVEAVAEEMTNFSYPSADKKGIADKPRPALLP